MSAERYPYPVRNPASIMTGKFGRLWIVGTTFMGLRAVYRHPNIETQLGVLDRVIPAEQVRHFARIDLEESALQSLLLELKEDMLNHGASSLAVQWVGELSPFSKKELNTMADKLTKKAAGAAKPAAKGAAKPKAEKAEKAAPADKTYKHLVKPDAAIGGTREGTWTRRMVEIIMGTKSTAEARAALAKDKEYSDKSLDFGWAAKKGFISSPA